jgi:hypothetical protein
MSKVYIRYISLWNETDSKSYISVIRYSRGTKFLYNMIHRTDIVANRVMNIVTKRGNLSDMNVNIYSE